MAKKRQFLKKNESTVLIYGYHAVMAALKNPKRKVKRVIMTEDFSKTLEKQLLTKIEEKLILNKKEFAKRYFFGGDNKQWVVLEVYKFENITLANILNQINQNKNCIIIMLDQIQNPQNIGSIIRSAALFGCETIITSKDHSPNMNSTIIKTASGGTEIVNYIQVSNLTRSIIEIKKHGFWVVGLDPNANKTIDQFEMPNKCLFIAGSESLGLRKLTKQNCDYLFSIKSKKNDNLKIDSLNVSNATTITLYEHFKKTI